jgi:phosphohistidine phosphatase
MKTLTLLRHAKSTWDDPVARDFDRPLNPRGRRAARTIGREMKRLGLAFDAVIASPAVRVRETVAEVATGYGPLAAQFDQRLYLASLDALLEIVRTQPDRASSLLLVAHNPGLELLTLALAAEREAPLRGEVETKYPTATLAELRLPAQRWSDAETGSAALARFIRPRDLDPELGPDGS